MVLVLADEHGQVEDVLHVRQGLAPTPVSASILGIGQSPSLIIAISDPRIPFRNKIHIYIIR